MGAPRQGTPAGAADPRSRGVDDRRRRPGPDQFEEAVRRLRPKNRYELLVARFAAAVVLATAPYHITTAKWAPYLRQRGVEAFPELVPDPPAVTRTIDFQKKGLATIMAWFKGEIVLHLHTATAEYKSYAARKAADEERRRGGVQPSGLRGSYP